MSSTVLVVDDDRANLDSVQRIFQKEGVATLGATTVLTPGAGAQPTPVTLTVAHPSIGGPGTTVTVRGTSPGAPAVAVTLPVYRYAGSVSGFSPGVGDDPQGMRPGDQ